MARLRWLVPALTHQHGSIVLRNKRTGAMNPAFDRQEIGTRSDGAS